MNKIETIDFEASGLGPDSYPIEVGYALSDGTCESYLIRPEPGWEYWDQCAEDQLHHISRDRLYREGLPAREIAEILNSQLETVYSDAVTFDTFWADRLFESTGIFRKFDILSISSQYKKNMAEHFYTKRRELFQEYPHHQVKYDALATQMAYEYALEKYYRMLDDSYGDSQ